jgi:hypothetical protein
MEKSKYFILTHENRTMKTVEIVFKSGEREKWEKQKGSN